MRDGVTWALVAACILVGLCSGSQVAWGQSCESPLEFVDRGGRCVMRHDAPRPSSWADEDGDCQNTRHEILLRDAIGPVKLSPDGCRVVWGMWADPYSGEWIIGNPGGNPAPIEIEHVIPRSYAQRGRRWSRAQFVRWYNDQRNLLISARAENQDKGSQGPSEWMPSFEPFHCSYGSIWRSGAKRWRIAVKPLDKVKLHDLLESCR